MSSCCSSGHCKNANAFFDEDYARCDLQDYQKHGPSKQTRWLLSAIKTHIGEANLPRVTLLDIGGGVGPVHNELLKAGIAHAIDVDGSQALINASKAEAARQGHADRIEYRFGDFVALADAIPKADVVTLDRVICCYPDMPALLTQAAAHSTQWLGLVFPCGYWWQRLGVRVLQVFNTLFNKMQFFVHSTQNVDECLRAAGFTRVFHKGSIFWQAMVYQKVG